MASYFWVGGTGTWDNSSKTNWATVSGGAGGNGPPTSSDDATFDANSGTSAVVTIASTATGNAVTINKSDINISLNGNVTFNGALTLTTGKITLNNNTLICGRFSSDNSNIRTIDFGTGNITISSTSAATIIGINTATNISYIGTPLFNCTYSGSLNTKFIRVGSTAGGSASTAINLNVTAGTDILNFGGYFNNINLTGFKGTSSLTVAPIVYGNLTFDSGMTYSGTTTLTFATNSGTQTITTNGITVDCPLTFNGVGGTFQLQDNCTVGSTRTVTLTNGTLDLNSKTLSCGLFSSSNSNTRSIAFGTGNITLTGSGATIWSTSTVTGFTLTGTPTVNCTYSGSTGTRTISTSTSFTETNVPNFNISAGSDTVDFGTSARRVGSVNFTGFTGTLSNFYVVSYGNLTLSSGMTLTDNTNIAQFAGTGTQTITSNGKTIPFVLAVFAGAEAGTRIFADALTIGAGRSLTMRGTVKFTAGTTNTSPTFYFSGSSTNQLYVQSTIPGTQYTLSQASGTVSATYSTIQDCIATGGATWQAFLTNGNINSGNNTGWDWYYQPGEYMYTRRKIKRLLIQ